MPEPTKLSDLIFSAAVAVAAEDIPQSGHRAMPHKDWLRFLRRAQWPIVMVTVDIPQYERGGVRKGQQTGSAPQPVATVPESWLRELAIRLGRPWSEACRGRIEGEWPKPT